MMAKADQPNPWRYVHLGLDLAVAAVVFVGLGWLLDARFDTAPWGILIGTAVGLTVGLYLFIRQARRALAQSLERSRRGRDAHAGDDPDDDLTPP